MTRTVCPRLSNERSTLRDSAAPRILNPNSAVEETGSNLCRGRNRHESDHLRPGYPIRQLA
eukprot:459254-Hanusia_phi.AAC.1